MLKVFCNIMHGLLSIKFLMLLTFPLHGNFHMY